MSMDPKVTRLDNGLTVLSDEMSHVDSVSVGVWVDAGARHETPARHGISHMLEHMAFKGTASRSAQRIAEEIENVGGHINAATSHETTAYYARVLKEDTPLALDILADILQRSAFESEELERERGVILQEIGQAADTPDDIVFDHLMSVSYPGQALGRPILGTPETVGGFSSGDLRAYMADRYHAPSMVVAAAGAVDHEALVGEVAEKFAALPAARPNEHERARFEGRELRDDKALEQAHVTLAFEGVPYGDPDYYTAQVFASVLGGGMSSRLFQEVREKRGLCYSVFSFNWSFADTGLFGVYAGTAPEDLSELMPVMADEIQRLGEDASEEETARARAQLKAGLLMGLESSSARAEQMARQMMVFGRLLPTEHVIGEVERVDAGALKAYAKRLLAGPAPALAAVGPLGGLEKQDRIAARFG